MNRRHAPSSVFWPLASSELVWWCAFASVTYSMLIPLIAFESGGLAEKLLHFSLLQQVAHFGITIVCILAVISDTMLRGWKLKHLWMILAALSLLSSIGPQTQCCSVLVSAISGSCPASELQITHIVYHLAPMLGCAWVMFDIWQESEGKSN